MLKVTINGMLCNCRDGSTVLDALRLLNIMVPTLCHDDRLAPYGGCRLCVVEIKGLDRPVPACNTMLSDGMEIETHTPQLKELRKTLLDLIVQSYPAGAVRRFPDKQLHRALRAYGMEDQCLGAEDAALADDSHPYIHVDMSRCIHCFRCVRICEDVQGQFVWKVWNRGDRTWIVPDKGGSLAASSCVSCGACVDTCPTGALEDKSLLSNGAPLLPLGAAPGVSPGSSLFSQYIPPYISPHISWTRTTCPYCGTGCEMQVGVRLGRIVSIKPALDASVNRGHLCVKGRYAFDFTHAPDRITEPMVRRNGDWKPVSWDYAISFLAEALRETVERYGPASVGVLGSARATNEENYLAQKFARLVLGTNNVDCCARVCHAPTAAALKAVLGTGAATNSYDDIELARTILVAGANPTGNHPIIGARIKQAALKGAQLIVIDPRRIELAGYAACHLQLRPGTNVPLFNAMAAAIVAEGLADSAFLHERVTDWEEYRQFIAAYAPEKMAEVCGVDAGLIRRAARLYAKDTPSLIIHGLGMTEHVQGTDGVMLLANLALLTGNLGKRGAGINPLRGQNNVQGSAHMGCEPKSFTGGVPLEDGRELFERVWKAELPSAPGLNLMEMLDAARDGRFKALWAIGYDVLLTNPNSDATRESLQAMDFVIVQDMFLNETAREFGSLFLPVASPYEKDGTFMNAERRIQRVRKAIEPAGNSKTDWEIMCLAARALGKGDGFDFKSAEEIWNEVRTVWKAGAGITYPRLEHAGLLWPCPTETHPGTAMLHADASAAKRFPLRRVAYLPTLEIRDMDFPFLLVTGRAAYQFNAGTMTMRTPNRELASTDLLEISPPDAARLGLGSGDEARVASRYGAAILPVEITDVVRPGELFATFHTAQVFLNQLTSLHRDSVTGTPEYKVTAVAVHKFNR
jgi:formate dehydrogenase major subunit